MWKQMSLHFSDEEMVILFCKEDLLFVVSLVIDVINQVFQIRHNIRFEQRVRKK